MPDIEALVAEAGAAIAAAGSVEEIREVAVGVTGKKSPLARAQRSLGALDEEARRELGRRINEGRAAVDDLLERRRTELTLAEMERSMRDDALDLSEFLPARPRNIPARGRPNLVTQTRDALEDVFVGMGFEVAEGPEIESDWYNFGALNMPPAHPARGMWDTFYLNLGEPESTVLRTHTSPVQIHLMERAVVDGTLPIHAVMPGRCYRRDTPDARHLPIFHQIEGLVVDRGITFADLAGTIEVFTSAYFVHHLPRRRLPDLLADGVDRARRLRHGRPGGLRGGRDRPRRVDRVRFRLRDRPVRPDAPPDRRHAGTERERHPIPAAVLIPSRRS